MELIGGDKLKDTLERERLSLARVLDLSVEVAEGLARAHDKGIVHRDLTPANIMLTEDGHAKIIDFGLAKLIEPLEDSGEETQTALRRETVPGIVMGTMHYMSPEQARGSKVDHRSDIFTFGIVLYEMLAGWPPFQGASGTDTLSAIIRDPAPPLPSLGHDVTPEAASDLQRVLEKCLAKEPNERYQGMKDAAVDLRAARRKLESGAVSGAISAPVAIRLPSKRWLWVGAAAAVLLLIAALALFLRPSPRPPATASSEKPSVAVLYFENNTGDPALDWLRTALTNMLVTDLAQSPDVEVLGTDSLYQILEEMNRLDDRVTSLEVVQEVAERAGVSTVLLGNFVKAGETIRINVRLQEAESGRVITSEKVEGVGEDSIFPMVDDLTRRIKNKFDIPRTADAVSDQNVADVTTSSVEALRYYVEGINFHDRFKEEEALPLLEKAVELDPEFAMALAKLAVVHNNLGHPMEAEEYGQRALEHVDRLSTRERYYVEGFYNDMKRERRGKAIESYKKLLELYPDHNAARHNLAQIYQSVERFDEAIEQLEELWRRGETFPVTFSSLASCYAARGEFEKGYAALRDLLQRTPESAVAHWELGNHLTRWGKLDEALEALDKAEALSPSSLQPTSLRWHVYMLREQWDEAQRANEKIAASTSDPFWQWGARVTQATTDLYRGRSDDALARLDEATRISAEPGPLSANARNFAAGILIARGDTTRALYETQMAEREGQGRGAEWRAIVRTGIAQAKSGQLESAETTRKKLSDMAETLPFDIEEERRLHQLDAEIALARGDAKQAAVELEQAESMLPARGSYGSQHVPIWYSLASAHLAAGSEADAAEWYRKVADSTTEHMNWPIHYVRSFYFLGKIHENRGEMDKARDYYQRFLDFWQDGDMDRERVEEARQKIKT
jgi:tetratricopeptide (TPR) repeat protein